MLKILIPVDGSENAHRAVSYAVKFAANSREPVELHLLNVQLPVISGDVKMFIPRKDVDDYYRDEGGKALAESRRLLAQSDITHSHHIIVGPLADTIATYAREKDCAQIIMGSRGMGALSGLLIGSVATKVLHLSPMPVTLVK